MSEPMPFPQALAEGSEVDSVPEMALPLAGNTGATSQSWHLDWFEFTSWGAEPNAIAELMSEVFHPGQRMGLEHWSAKGGAKFYGRRYEYLGATLLTESQAKGAEENVHGVIPGEVCGGLGVDSLLGLFVRIKAWSTKCRMSRLDVAVDGVPFTPADAYRAVLAGETVSWAKGDGGIVTHSWRSSNGPERGDTLYIGSRRSERFLRIYNRRGPTRIELETKGDYANAMAIGLVNLPSRDREQVEFVVGCVREFCDFGRAKYNGHGVFGGLELLPWWLEFVGSVDRIGKLVVDRRMELSVDRSLSWIERSVVPSLSMVMACYRDAGRELLDGWIDEGMSRLTQEQEAAIREFRNAYANSRFLDAPDDREAA